MGPQFNFLFVFPDDLSEAERRWIVCDGFQAVWAAIGSAKEIGIVTPPSLESRRLDANSCGEEALLPCAKDTIVTIYPEPGIGGNVQLSQEGNWVVISAAIPLRIVRDRTGAQWLVGLWNSVVRRAPLFAVAGEEVELDDRVIGRALTNQDSLFDLQSVESIICRSGGDSESPGPNGVVAGTLVLRPARVRS